MTQNAAVAEVIPRDELIARMVRAGELEVSGEDQQETDRTSTLRISSFTVPMDSLPTTED